MKILDCTLRDGGYYTQWDFDRKLIDQYIRSLDELPIDYIELGYRSPKQKSYYGKFFYLPIYEIETIKSQTKKKLSVILNENDIDKADLPSLLKPIQGLVEMIRVAVRPSNIKRATELIKEIRKYDFEISFNLMYLSDWDLDDDFSAALKELNQYIDIFYMVDSYGSVLPEDIEKSVKILKENLSCALGFHGHNNLEAALLNSLKALELGVEYIDSTILGMGRGAGNLKTELLLTVLNKRNGLDVNFNALEHVVSAFRNLQKKYNWGTSLPYMISGANSIPQKEVMEWLTVRYYSLNSIVRALNNRKNKKEDNEKFPVCDFPKSDKIVIVGGGPSISYNINGILKFLENDPNIVIVHASAKNAGYFKDLKNKQYFCLVGNEGRRMEATLKDLSTFNGICVLPPFPREMGTYVPESVKDKTQELEEIRFTDKYFDAHTTLAIQIALNCSPKQILFIGYDGYSADSITQKEMKLIEENNYLFSKLGEHLQDYYALTHSLYDLDASENLFYKLSQ